MRLWCVCTIVAAVLSSVGQAEVAEQTDSVDREGLSNARILWAILLLVLLYLVSRILIQAEGEPNVPVRDANCSHYWLFSDMVISLPLHCSVCHSFLLTSKGHYCANCGVACCASADCWSKTNKSSFSCKETSACSGGTTTAGDEDLRPKFRHHWVAGNLPLNSECEVCEEPCGDGPGIVDVRCCWCQRTVHHRCQIQLSELCDLGEFSRFIIPPYCVQTRSGRTVRNPKRKIVSQVVHTPASDWNPLVVIGNRKSGNNDTAAFLAQLRAQLNPSQVLDVCESQIEDGLKWCQLVGGKAQCYCLIAGGDGTISWVLNTVDKMGLAHPPAIALFPLGTGNDLARSLGYGAGSDSSEKAQDVLRRLKAATLTQLDRWKVTVRPINPWRFGIQLSGQELFMHNYLSIGVDALVTYNFHKARESPFYLISNRIINKLIYFSYGTKDVIERECKDLDKILDLYLDGVKVQLPSVESVVVLNIPCWGAGVKPWTLGKGHVNYDPQSFNDQLLEVFCVFSSFHIAQMQVGLSEPHRLGQAKQVRIRLYGSVPMQVDGEPWKQHPAELVIAYHKSVPVLQVRSEF